MAKTTKKKAIQVDFPFYKFLFLFYQQEKKRIFSTYSPLTKKFLNFNNPENSNSFLRKPQFEALEMYIFLKDFCDNRYLYQIFEDWFYKQNQFENRKELGINERTGQFSIFDPIEQHQEEGKKVFQEVFNQIKSFQQVYPNYIFALTMGLGKTVLMATSIFYEFLLANKYPQDERYCHNALVFAPDKTVLYSLKEIQTFDKSKVVPPEYVNWLDANLKFFYLDETGDALNAIENSSFNIIISNTQKIILKKQHKIKTPSQALFEDTGKSYKAKSLNVGFEDLYEFDVNTDQDLITNQRFAKLTRLRQLGIYVDEAHHVFGNALADDLISTKKTTSLRVTINELAANLKDAGSKVVACYNYTGTPYVGSRLLPEVVYAYGLSEAINNKYLKMVNISGFENIKDQTIPFVRLAIKEFWETNKGKRFEGMLPKMAFFASNIEELQTELKPAVELILSEMNIPSSKILVNVGDSTITTNDDLREFKNLDTPNSDKQFILLVNKGKEGWNCRSLFAVGLHREPKSKIFVLQATMRCLRQIGDLQETGLVFLSDENIKILDAELQENFKLTVDDLNNAKDKKETIEIRLVPPPVKIKLRRVRKLHQLKNKTITKGIDLKFDLIDFEKYKIIRSERNIMDITKKVSADKDFTHIKERRRFSELTLVAEISKYFGVDSNGKFHLSPLRTKEVLCETKQGIENILENINEYNELLYDWVIPRLFSELYEIIEFKTDEEIEIELIKEPKEGDCYRVKADKNLVASILDERYKRFNTKSFHLDNYCFDSKPESHLYWTLLHDSNIDKVWFTGMLTHGQSDFVISYIDPGSHTVRGYYPDFLVKLNDGSYIILEVKGDNMIEDEVVVAKAEYAKQLAVASKMTYKMIKGSDAMNGVGIS
ncbi:MAG: TnsA endonuclease N-terminal domain-containing protein [Bacteroidota bacterium]